MCLHYQILKTILGSISASMFIGKSDGKLRDFYRIGKILGTGKYNLSEIEAFWLLNC
jgi:hypothetical protein